jgi:bidirectional [NiFe] hydrogenase diaphorase subunit
METKNETPKCLMCGKCVRTCEKIVGVGALKITNLSDKKANPEYQVSDACIACGSCYFGCPVHHIQLTEKGDTRFFETWGASFKLKKCNKCGDYWAPEKQLDYMIKKAKLNSDAFDMCPDCR